MRNLRRSNYNLIACFCLACLSILGSGSSVERAVALACHFIAGMHDTQHLPNHFGAHHQHRHPGQSTPHKHGEIGETSAVAAARPAMKESTNKVSEPEWSPGFLPIRAALLVTFTTSNPLAPRSSPTLSSWNATPMPDTLRHSLLLAANAPPLA